MRVKQAFQSRNVDTVLEDSLTSHSLARKLGSGPELYPPMSGGSAAQVPPYSPPTVPDQRSDYDRVESLSVTVRKMRVKQAFQSQAGIRHRRIRLLPLARKLGSGPELYPPMSGGSAAQVLVGF